MMSTILKEYVRLLVENAEDPESVPGWAEAKDVCRRLQMVYVAFAEAFPDHAESKAPSWTPDELEQVFLKTGASEAGDDHFDTVQKSRIKPNYVKISDEWDNYFEVPIETFERIMGMSVAEFRIAKRAAAKASYAYDSAVKRQKLASLGDEDRKILKVLGSCFTMNSLTLDDVKYVQITSVTKNYVGLEDDAEGRLGRMSTGIGRSELERDLNMTPNELVKWLYTHGARRAKRKKRINDRPYYD